MIRALVGLNLRKEKRALIKTGDRKWTQIENKEEYR